MRFISCHIMSLVIKSLRGGDIHTHTKPGHYHKVTVYVARDI